jgi:PncC family amidohydrolase
MQQTQGSDDRILMQSGGVDFVELVQLAAHVGELMRANGLTLATAESCTGGLIGHLITEVPGSSDFFMGAAVVYSYGAKEAVVGVRHETLMEVGAVSAQVAAQMAQGARTLYTVDVAVSVTGIAGPGGGTPDKPSGTTFLHLSAADAEWGRHCLWQGDRAHNKLQSARVALEMVQEYVQRREENDGL